jgi:Cysteine-rich CPCC
MRGLERMQATWEEWRTERRRKARIRSGQRRACPCCGSLTLESDEGDYEICPVCFWEDDPVQLRDPTYEGGANAVSLEQARRNYRQHGASEQRFKDDVRPPTPEEQPPDNA